MRLKSGYRRADRSNSRRNEWIEPYGEDEKGEGRMMADGGGTFRCATMLCGNNAQTNDSAVPIVITRGTRSFFPLLNPLLPFPYPNPHRTNYPSMCTLSFLSLSSCRLFIFPSAFTLAFLSLARIVPRPSSSTPFSLLWLLNQRTSATTIDPPTLEPLPSLPPSRLCSPPKYSRFHSRSLHADREKRELGHQSTNTRSFLQDFLCAP